MDDEVRQFIREMYWDFCEQRLQTLLVPQRDPPNPGACLRISVSCNAPWYQDMWGDFESRRKRQYRKFKTRVKRRDIERILRRLIDGKPCAGIYADWIKNYAQTQKERYENK